MRERSLNLFSKNNLVIAWNGSKHEEKKLAFPLSNRLHSSLMRACGLKEKCHDRWESWSLCLKFITIVDRECAEG